MVNRIYTSLAPTNPTRQRYQRIIDNSRSKLLSERYGTSQSNTAGSAGKTGASDTASSSFQRRDTSNMSVEEKLDYQQKQLDDIWNMMRSMSSGAGNIYGALSNSGRSNSYSALMKGLGYGLNNYSWI